VVVSKNGLNMVAAPIVQCRPILHRDAQGQHGSHSCVQSHCEDRKAPAAIPGSHLNVLKTIERDGQTEYESVQLLA